MHEYYTPKNKNQQNSKCPHCGVNKNLSSVFHSSMDTLAGSASLGTTTLYRSRPVRASNVQSDLLVPAGQAMVSAIVTAFPATLINLWFRWEWYAPLAVASVTIMVQWFRFLNSQETRTSEIEEVSFSNEASGEIPQMRPGSASGIQLEVVEKEAGFQRSMKFSTLPASISIEDFVSFSKDILAGKSMARAQWAGGGKIFSRASYDHLMRELINVSVVEKAPEGGKRLTRGGKRALSVFVRDKENEGKMS